MVARDAIVYAFAPDYTDNTKKQVVELGAVPVDFQMNRTGVNPVKEMLAIVRLAGLLKDLRVDASLGFMTKLVVYGSLAAFFAGVPRRCSMVEGLGYFFTDGDPKPSARKAFIRHAITLLYRMSLPLNRTVFFLNPDDRRDLAAGMSPGRYSTVILGGIGIDTREYTSAPLDCDQIAFILVARLLKEKGVREYVSAAEKVKQVYPRASFVLVGGLDTNPGGIEETEAREWVERGVIEWPGSVPDVKPWLSSASIYVLPSYYREGMPRSTLEAMAMGRPVITTDAPGCRETIARYDPNEEKRRAGKDGVIEGKNGFLVPVRNVDALVAAMERFIKEPELIPCMGAASRKLAEEKFDVRKVNAVILKAMGLESGSDEQ